MSRLSCVIYNKNLGIQSFEFIDIKTQKTETTHSTKTEYGNKKLNLWSISVKATIYMLSNLSLPAFFTILISRPSITISTQITSLIHQKLHKPLSRAVRSRTSQINSLQLKIKTRQVILCFKHYKSFLFFLVEEKRKKKTYNKSILRAAILNWLWETLVRC